MLTLLIFLHIISFMHMRIELYNSCVQTSDFDSVSEDDDDDDESDSDSSGCEWETEEEELLTVDSSSRSVEENPGIRNRTIPR